MDYEEYARDLQDHIDTSEERRASPLNVGKFPYKRKKPNAMWTQVVCAWKELPNDITRLALWCGHTDDMVRMPGDPVPSARFCRECYGIAEERGTDVDRIYQEGVENGSL